MIPLILRLKKEAHRDIAKAQDLIIEELYKVFDTAVLHGGTSIWRCYGGNRFSEDIDVYLVSEKGVNVFFENLAKRGLVVLKKKISKKSVFSTLRLERTIVRFEAIFKKAESILCEYETIDGNLITVYALAPENLIKEKVDAYVNRHKVRDLYDTFFLLRHVKSRLAIEQYLKRLIKNYKEPIDEKDLKVLIIEGLVPNSEKMLTYIKNWM